MSAARFEICHTGPHKFHARFVAANNEVVWVTESYRTRRAAMEAIWGLENQIVYGGLDGVQTKLVDERTSP